LKNVKAEKFNEKASRSESKPNEVIAALDLKPGQKIVDLGAGGGYFSLRFAEEVGERGAVYAVDVNPQFLVFVSNAAEEKGLKNVETVLASENGFSLPDKVDLIFVRNAYHHLRDRTRYFKKLKRVLKPNGKLAVVEYCDGGFFSFRHFSFKHFFSFRRWFGHFVPEKTIEREMGDAGYRLVKKFDFLKEQSFSIFSKQR